MAKPIESRRANQRRRTRKDLLAAAGRLLKAGKTPGMDEVAAEAMVSRATAYRYFPRVEALLVEAPLDGAVPGAEEVFKDETETDPEVRVDMAEAALHEMVYRNEAQLRVMLAASLERTSKGPAEDGIPVRQNRRAGLIDAALAPARKRFTPATYERLAAALAVLFGTESMIVFSDVLGVDPKTARKVKSWATRALVRAALEESKARR
ncbi:MAG: TetR family transcriptional regulator [Planctomycetota bacterium]|nr:TetR family transcriptional regulator [Planctomycetota bacterium]